MTVNCFECETWTQGISSIILCAYGKLPMTYLELTLQGNPSKVKYWKPVLNKVTTRLALWKGKMLAKAGILQLIKYVLSNLPTSFLV